MQSIGHYREFFKKATGFYPFPYQEMLANSEYVPAKVTIPTGLGKTAGAVLAWAWRRRFASNETRLKTPRRLVYCLPMRVLVEQTANCAISWLDNLDILGGEVKKDQDGKIMSYDPHFGKSTHSYDKIRVYSLLGGEADKDWDEYPEQDAIIIGTQDMLLSRALNRGYGMSRFRWPMHFALLNNDCLWIMDEIQLMGNGLATTTQLQAFRRLFGSSLPILSQWMSATMREQWLDTVDFDLSKDAHGELALSENDKKIDVVNKRLNANKILSSSEANSKDGKSEAQLILDKHELGSRTLVVVNTVKKAVAIYESLKKLTKKTEPKFNKLVLLHSRFKLLDRKQQMANLLEPPEGLGTIAICTQVVEAGVDISSKTMITELAPWSSLVQRFGRCNREGEFEEANIFWLNIDLTKKGAAAPYEVEELKEARSKLETINQASPNALPLFESELKISHVIRQKDIVELFDTTPDLAGADIDISRFIREQDEHGVSLFWRDLEEKGKPDSDEPLPHKNELCTAPIGEVKAWIKKKKHNIYKWDHLEKEWSTIKYEAIAPGMVLMLDTKAGGYNPEIGWHTATKKTEIVEGKGQKAEAMESDWMSQKTRETLQQHTDKVLSELDVLLEYLDLNQSEHTNILKLAAKWHDAGKAHEVFQKALANDKSGSTILAKSDGQMKNYKRRGFRHELASALAMLKNGLPDLAVYLAAAHHGKVRLSIRSLPNESEPRNHEKRFARGVWDGDILPACKLCKNTNMPETILDLSYMELGEGENGASWLARMLDLRDDKELGVFRLAYLETLLRTSDWRGSSLKGGK